MSNLDLIFEDDLDVIEGDVRNERPPSVVEDDASRAAVREVAERVKNPGSRLVGVVRGW